MTVEGVRRLAQSGRLDEAVEAVRDRLATVPANEVLTWARLAQEIGCAADALPALRRALQERDDPRVRREVEALEEERVASPAEPTGEVSAGDLARFVHLFSGREDVYARQWWDGSRGGYSPIRQPLTAEVARAHLAGTATVGAYPLRLDGTATWLCLDLDLTRAALSRAATDAATLRRLQQQVHEAGLALRTGAESLGLSGILADSGYKGRHLWVFFATPFPGPLAHRLAVALAHALAPDDRALTLEAFPKQGAVAEGGLGNLVKLPLGVHRRTGRRAAFLDETGRPLDDPWPALRGVKPLGREEALDLLGRLRPPPVPPLTDEPAPIEEEPEDDLEALKAVVSGCAVVAAILQKAQTERRLLYDERVVLRHAIGHLQSGATRFNAALDLCPEVPSRERINRPLRGHPISCGNIRRRLPGLTARLPCHCAFSNLDHYPTPALHRSIPPEAPPITRPAGPEVADGLSEALRRLGGALPVEGGVWRVDEEGRPVFEEG